MPVCSNCHTYYTDDAAFGFSGAICNCDRAEARRLGDAARTAFDAAKAQYPHIPSAFKEKFRSWVPSVEAAKRKLLDAWVSHCSLAEECGADPHDSRTFAAYNIPTMLAAIGRT